MPTKASSVDDYPSIPLSISRYENMPKFQFTQVDTDYIKKAVVVLKNPKLLGSDKIPTKLLKDTIEVICQPLATLFNASLRKGTFQTFGNLCMSLQSSNQAKNQIY